MIGRRAQLIADAYDGRAYVVGITVKMFVSLVTSLGP